MEAPKPATGSSLPAVAWHISTRSGNGSGNCVEAGPVLDGSGWVAVRNSRHRDGCTVVYSGAAWTAFLAGVKADDFA